MESRGEYQSETHIRDPVYDEVGLSSLELEVLDQPEVQRLRQIKQLGAVARVYPSATHTRFSHSIGVMHLSGLIGNRIGLDEEEITEVRLAGLLHDTGHGPFSHTSEEVVGEEVFKHEQRSARIAEDICSDLPVDEENISSYILGDKKPSIVAGVIDSDRLDYIIRDSIFTAVDHGKVDVNSVVRFSCLDGNELSFEEKAIPSMNDMLSARQRMRKVVYRYSTVRHFSTLIKRAMESFVEKESVQDLIQHDDYTMHSKLLENKDPFYQQVVNRNLSRERFEFGLDKVPKSVLRTLSEESDTDIRNTLQDKLGLGNDQVLVSSPYIPDNIPENIRIVGEDGESGQLSEFSPYPTYLNEEAWNDATFISYIEGSQSVQEDDVVSILKSYYG